MRVEQECGTQPNSDMKKKTFSTEQNIFCGTQVQLSPGFTPCDETRLPYPTQRGSNNSPIYLPYVGYYT